MFKLVIADDEGKTFVVPLVRDEISIGRKEGNTIRLTERNVSRKHARLRRANGGFHLEDLSSYNGVKVNGKKIGGETDLKAGDQITIGDYQLALQVEGDTQPTVPEATAPTAGVPGADAVTAMITAPGGPPARLVMMSPPNPGQEFALNRATMRLGRAEDLDIWVNHRSISREHAEITKVGDETYRISDLASANGLRINGVDQKNAELQPGDVVEIGQVRFKFVPAGEAFVFDEGRTMQMDALSFEREGPNRTPIYIAVGIVVLAIIAGVAVTMGSGEPEPEPTVTVIATSPTAVPPVAPPPIVAVPPGAGTDAEVAAAITACNTALAAGNFDEAAAQANRALGIRPGDTGATACLELVEQTRADAEIVSRALAAQAAGDLDGAFMTLGELPEESAYRSSDQVAAIVAAWAQNHVTIAEGMEATDAAGANTAADEVLAYGDWIPPDWRERAQALERRTHSAGRTIARSGSSGGRTGSSGGRVTPPGGSSGSSGSSGSGGSPATGSSGGSSSSSSGGSSSSSSGGSSSSSGGGSSSGGAAEEDEGASLYDQARAAALTGNHREVIRLLNGHCRAQREYELLIESLRAVPGMEADVVRNMRAYLSRFPSTPRARAYQQYLMTHGG